MLNQSKKEIDKDGDKISIKDQNTEDDNDFYNSGDLDSHQSKSEEKYENLERDGGGKLSKDLGWHGLTCLDS